MTEYQLDLFAAAAPPATSASAPPTRPAIVVGDLADDDLGCVQQRCENIL